MMLPLHHSPEDGGKNEKVINLCLSISKIIVIFKLLMFFNFYNVIKVQNMCHDKNLYKNICNSLKISFFTMN